MDRDLAQRVVARCAPREKSAADPSDVAEKARKALYEVLDAKQELLDELDALDGLVRGATGLIDKALENAEKEGGKVSPALGLEDKWGLYTRQFKKNPQGVKTRLANLQKALDKAVEAGDTLVHTIEN